MINLQFSLNFQFINDQFSNISNFCLLKIASLKIDCKLRIEN
jgi:hypothetical protein